MDFDQAVEAVIEVARDQAIRVGDDGAATESVVGGEGLRVGARVGDGGAVAVPPLRSSDSMLSPRK